MRRASDVRPDRARVVSFFLVPYLTLGLVFSSSVSKPIGLGSGLGACGGAGAGGGGAGGLTAGGRLGLEKIHISFYRVD